MQATSESFIMWGERGLVATMLLDLHRSKGCASWSSFLKACDFEPNPSWLEEAIKSVAVVVEPDFSNEGFGHPDGIIKVEYESGAMAVLILEAKRLPYAKCCVLPNNRGGAGYNSTLNGQLELNHCLALALSQFGPESTSLTEPNWVLHCPYAVERRGRLRALKNPVVIEEVAHRFAGLPFRSYYHIVITTDDSNPLENPENTGFWPELYHPDYPFQNCWNELRSQFTWISWRSVEACLRGFIGEGGVHESLFVPSYETNRRNFKQASATVAEQLAESEAVDSVQTQADEVRRALRAGGRVTDTSSARGATMIYAPAINPNTFVHFSWLNESCAIRDYSKSPTIMPFEDRQYRTSDVRARVEKQISIRNRQPISDTQYWYETTKSLNASELSLARAATNSSK